MNNIDKKEVIKRELARNYSLLQDQCLIKIKTYHVFRNLDANELLSDILFNFLEKLENPQFLERIYLAYQNGKLISFIGKTIDNQARYTKGPFLQKQIKKFCETELKEIYYYIADDDEPDESQDTSDEFLASEILVMVNQIEKNKLLGEYTFYYVKLFRDYISDTKTTYKDLADKYGISFSTVVRDLIYFKKCIILLLKEKGTKFPKNRKSKFQI
jgi:hypothetical protein